MNEKRKYPRIHLNSEVSILIAGQSKYFRLVDISMGGMSFISERVISDETELTLDIGDSAKVNMKVLEGDFEWLDEDAAIAGYKVRCRFNSDMDEETWGKTQNYLHEHEVLNKK